MRGWMIRTIIAMVVSLTVVSIAIERYQKSGGLQADGDGSNLPEAFRLPAIEPTEDQIAQVREAAEKFQVTLKDVDHTLAGTNLSLSWTGCGRYLGPDFIDSLQQRGLIRSYQSVEQSEVPQPGRPTMYQAVFLVRFEKALGTGSE